MPKLTIIRGLPGSGKSTLAQKMCDDDRDQITLYFEADMYWERPDGIYDFNPKYIGEAHDWCFSRMVSRMEFGFNVIVSNTFTRWKELKNYVEFCLEQGYNVEVITLTENYGSIHGVPEATLAKMTERMESHKSILEEIEKLKDAKSPANT